MNALALALLLLAEAPSTEPPSTEPELLAVAPAPEVQDGGLLGPASAGAIARPITSANLLAVETDRRDRGLVRLSLGGGGVTGLSGVSPTVLVGVELAPWRYVGLRTGVGMVAATGGGAWSAAELSAAVVLHGRPGMAFDPYLSVGGQIGVLSIYRSPRVAPVSFATSTGGEPLALPDSASGRGPISSYAAPELQVGVSTRLRGRLSLDIGVRYLPLSYGGETRHGVSGLVAICTPF